MGLFRLWWVPAGMTPDRGAYVRYHHEAMVGVLTGEAVRAGALAIGEDLGTVERGSTTTWPPTACWARPCCGSSAAGTAFPARPGSGAAAAWPPSARTTSRRWPPSSPASRSRCGPVSACWPATWMQNALTPPRPCGPGRTPSPGKGWPGRWAGWAVARWPAHPAGPGGVHRRALRLPRAHPGRAGGGLTGGCRRGTPPPEPARHRHAVPELVRPARRRRRPAGPAGGPGRPSAARARRRRGGQPAWRSRAWQRSARSTASRPSMSRRRNAAGGSVLEIRASVASIAARVSAMG